MYSELCEKLYEQNANNFMSVFNELDKHLDGFVGSEKFMPYNEKLKELSKGQTTLSLFIKKYEKKLKYFGELRNHIAHGFKLDGKHYTTPSYHAVDELRKIKDAIMKPVGVGSVFKKQVYTCQTTDTLKEVMQAMRNFHYTHIPVYNEQRVMLGVISQSVICEWLLSKNADTNSNVEKILISDLDLSLGNERYEIIEEGRSLFSIPPLFEQTGLNQKRLGAIFITENGNVSEPLTGVITTFDLPLLAQYSFVD